jgi:hypothetical protein
LHAPFGCAGCVTETWICVNILLLEGVTKAFVSAVFTIEYRKKSALLLLDRGTTMKTIGQKRIKPALALMIMKFGDSSCGFASAAGYFADLVFIQ